MALCISAVEYARSVWRTQSSHAKNVDVAVNDTMCIIIVSPDIRRKVAADNQRSKQMWDSVWSATPRLKSNFLATTTEIPKMIDHKGLYSHRWQQYQNFIDRLGFPIEYAILLLIDKITKL